MRHSGFIAMAALLAATFVPCIDSSAQSVTVKDTVMVTYPFSDPNPIPKATKIYPYFRYDGFTSAAEKKEWKTVILENDKLRVRIMPEIGGKVWSVYDKVNGKEIFYDNDAVKFRDIAMRGPWTSGGIEFNFGIIGHTPSTAFPVDYKTVKKEDGTVSCYIGSIDLLTRTHWTVEISLPADKAVMATRVIWHNGSGLYQPYYTWMNSGVKATDNMHLIYPGAYSVAHGGGIDPWPVDEKGRDLRIYENQKYGSSKSMHVAGSGKGFFSVWWPDDEEGVMHIADRDQKLGRKYFTWALSDQGDIWRELLTDGRTQYVELQSGRLFNQNDYSSHKTPYKQFLFQPFGTDEWTEYWFPYAETGGAESATEYAVVNPERRAGGLFLNVYPLQKLSGKLEVFDKEGKLLHSEDVSLGMSQPECFSVPASAYRFCIGGVELWSDDPQLLSRPDATPSDYDWETASAQYLYAKYCLGQRLYEEAGTHADKALKADGKFVPAIGMKAFLQLRKGLSKEAWDTACEALAIDTYDPTSNYVYGLASEALGKMHDAIDGFELAAIPSDLRSAALTQLARLHFRRGQYAKACEYAERSLSGNSSNLSALEIKALCAARLGGSSEDVLKEISRIDPLCHFPDFARFLEGKMSSEALGATFHEEMRWQEYLETAIWLHSLGLDDEGAELIAACPEKNVLMSLWRAWLKKDASLIRKAESESLDYAFPFRTESLEPLKWACSNGGGWKSRWMQGLLLDFLGRTPEAVSLVKDIKDADYAPFYAWRAGISSDPSDDLKKAAQIDPGQWRYCNLLTEYYLSKSRYNDALATVEPFYKSSPSNPHITDAYVRSLRGIGNYKKADQVLRGIEILPFEGQTNTHSLYRDVKLHLAAEALDKGSASTALKRLAESREWPHNLGSGKPYDELIDYSLQDWMTAVAYARKGDKAKAGQLLSGIRNQKNDWQGAYEKAVSRKETVSSLIEALEPGLKVKR
ncbi:MAG: DUF5107 domain-containing protein [Bacteroidales bacterium]|nr:DUF5107 domain-containing protein [Bacteroidales bacterium]